MALHVLDTNTLSYLIDPASPFHAAARAGLARLTDADEAAISILSLYELHHWLAYHPARAPRADVVMRSVAVLSVPEAGAARFGGLMRAFRAGATRADLRRHAIDCMIAVTALAQDAVLVSNDAIFPRLAKLTPDLRLADWTAAG